MRAEADRLGVPGARSDCKGRRVCLSSWCPLPARILNFKVLRPLGFIGVDYHRKALLSIFINLDTTQIARHGAACQIFATIA